MHRFPALPTPLRYRDEVTQELLRMGLAPGPTVQPRLIYQFLRALMTFEIRGLKAKRREVEAFFGPQPLADYTQEIGALREKYAVLRRLPPDWVTLPKGNQPPSGE